MLTACYVFTLGLLHWFYAFKMWAVGEKLKLIGENKDPESNIKSQNAIFYSIIALDLLGSILYGYSQWFYRSKAWGAAFYDIAELPSILSVFFLVLGMLKIRLVLKNDSN